MGHVSVYLCDFCSRGDTPSRPVLAQQHDREPRFTFVCSECVQRFVNALTKAREQGTSKGMVIKAEGQVADQPVPQREGGYPPVVNPPPFTDPRAEDLVQSPPPPAAPKPEQGPPILKERSQENIQFPYRT